MPNDERMTELDRALTLVASARRDLVAAAKHLDRAKLQDWSDDLEELIVTIGKQEKHLETLRLAWREVHHG